MLKMTHLQAEFWQRICTASAAVYPCIIVFRSLRGTPTGIAACFNYLGQNYEVECLFWRVCLQTSRTQLRISRIPAYRGRMNFRWVWLLEIVFLDVGIRNFSDEQKLVKQYELFLPYEKSKLSFMFTSLNFSSYAILDIGTFVHINLLRNPILKVNSLQKKREFICIVICINNSWSFILHNCSMI